MKQTNLFTIILSLFFVTLTSKVSAIDIRAEALNIDLVSLTDEMRQYHQEVAEHWAPVYFADGKLRRKLITNAAGQQESVFEMSPANAIVDPYFDGDEDWRNNPENLYARDANGAYKHKFKARIPYSVIRTKTHLFISYMKYNADDIGPGKHGQDAETVWVVVRRTEGKAYGELEFVATNAHGFPKFYSPNEETENRVWENYAKIINQKDATLRSFIGFGDLHAQTHHGSGRPVFLRDEETRDHRGLFVFVCGDGHALYKCNPEAWENGSGSGYIYACVPQGEEGETICFPVAAPENRRVGYSLFSIDDMITSLYPRNENERPADERARLKNMRDMLFEGNQRGDFSRTVGDGVLRLRREVPIKIVRGNRDSKGHATMFNTWSMKTQDKYMLAMPHEFYSILMGVTTEELPGLDQYEYNPYIEFTKTN